MCPDYSKLYEDHASKAGDPTMSIGDGDFDQVGRFELAILKLEGLRPQHSLLDLGCGIGRLALQAIPYLTTGRYLGLDISPTMIEGAKKLARDRLPGVPDDRYRFETNDGEEIAGGDATFDMICAFSVFTHMEAEDTYRYMCKLGALLPPSHKLVASVLPLETDLGRQIFLKEAALPPTERWNRVRNVATSYALMEHLATMAGFRNFRWYRGNEFGIRLDEGACTTPGQSVLVAEKI